MSHFSPDPPGRSWGRSALDANAKKCQVLVVGMGAVGTMAAYAMEAGGKANVTAVLRSNYDIVEKQGFTIDSIDHGKITNWRPSRILKSVPVANNSDHRYDYLVLATKNTPDAGPNLLDLIAPALTPGLTGIVFMQNGINFEMPYSYRFSTNHKISSVQMIGAEEISPGHILHSEPDISYVGIFDAKHTCPAPNRCRDVTIVMSVYMFRNMYNACDKVKCEVEIDGRATRWRKLLYNASFNSVSAITGLDVSRMRIHEHVIENLIKPIMREIIAIAAADGTKLVQDGQTAEEVMHKVITVDKMSSWFMPSMGQDVLKGNYLEFENIVGQPLIIARELGVYAPTLGVVYGILRGIQERIRERRGDLVISVEMAQVYKD